MGNNNNTYLCKASSWQTKINQAVTQCSPPYNAKLKLVYIMKYIHALTSSQSRPLQWNKPLVHNGIPQGTINSSRSSIGNWVSCLHDWLLLANVINYSRLSQLIALRNLTNPTNIITKYSNGQHHLTKRVNLCGSKIRNDTENLDVKLD